MAKQETGNRTERLKPAAMAPGAIEGQAIEQNRQLNIARLMQSLPESHAPYTDKYFLRSNQILQAEGHNPFVRAQVFIRKGPGTVAGMDEAIAVLKKFSAIEENGGRIYAMRDGDRYESAETQMIIEARVQDIMELETVYLGVLSGETTRVNTGKGRPDAQEVKEKVQSIVASLKGKPFLYFGPRHYRYDHDAHIAAAAFEGGAVGTSSDIGAAVIDAKGQGTIPHALENVYAAIVGKENAVVQATKAFDRVIDPAVPRVALIDYNNKEVEDSIACAEALEGRLSAVRIDTCGENLAQGAFECVKDVPEDHPLQKVIPLIPEEELKYWFRRGVSVSGTFAVRDGLNNAGHPDVGVFLSSGFGDLNKVKAFMNAELILRAAGLLPACGTLFDGVGVGGVSKPCLAATMDIVAVADSREELDAHPMSKVGRPYRPNPDLELVVGE